MCCAYPDIALYNLPLVFRNSDEVDYVRERLDAKLMAGLREKKFVGLVPAGFAYRDADPGLRRWMIFEQSGLNAR